MPQSHSYGLTQRCLGALIHLEFSHEEITLGISLLLFLPDWINTEEPADDDKGIALQNDKTSYTPTKLPDCQLCQESTQMNHACVVCTLPPGGGGIFCSSVFNRSSRL